MIFSPFFNSTTALVPSLNTDLTSVDGTFTNTTEASVSFVVAAVVVDKIAWLAFAII